MSPKKKNVSSFLTSTHFPLLLINIFLIRFKVMSNTLHFEPLQLKFVSFVLETFFEVNPIPITSNTALYYLKMFVFTIMLKHTKQVPYILAYKSRNLGPKSEHFFPIRLICGSLKTRVFLNKLITMHN
jgi:hypothetical protein